MVRRSADLAPSAIRFTQDSIMDRFGHDSDVTLEETFRQLLHGEASVEEDQRLHLGVVVVEGFYWVVSGNRRLYLYRRLEQKGLLDTVPVHIQPVNQQKFAKMKTTKNDGRKVAIRQDPHHATGDKLSDRLDQIYSSWCREQRRQKSTPGDNHNVDTGRPNVESERLYHQEDHRLSRAAQRQSAQERFRDHAPHSYRAAMPPAPQVRSNSAPRTQSAARNIPQQKAKNAMSAKPAYESRSPSVGAHQRSFSPGGVRSTSNEYLRPIAVCRPSTGGSFAKRPAPLPPVVTRPDSVIIRVEGNYESESNTKVLKPTLKSKKKKGCCTIL